ncbi:bifunctional metallophosphatase/5'-nucleotidase [Alteromonas gilva]|uniref:5'-nucleotidase C-terminal domain-containing protein n=1 Tax=Alteromonas gilva TaxID=2987522 RepID=A0ABT5KZ23_9ALTE|nr:5'-nucleotidase C-terminal domain-containing protein [Alteromonas gilva]MDC8830020.1 5'-nucleotidase C-terminal domain-containing protein [Alteromonas gilva]
MLCLIRGSSLLLIFLSAVVATSVIGATRNLTLIYAAEMPLIDDPNGNYAQLATLLKRSRDEQPTVFLFGGASLAPSLLSSLDRGAHVIDVLNSLEPDAMAVAKREFSFFEDELSLRAYEAAFPIILSNAYDPATQGNVDGLREQLIINQNNVKVGVIVALHESVIAEFRLTRLQVNDAPDVFYEQARQMRESGADIIVLMVSNDHPFLNQMLEDSTIDLVLRTDPHFDQSNTLMADTSPGYVFVTQRSTAAVLSLSWQSDTAADVSLNVDQVPLNSLPEEPAIAQQINAYTKRISALLKEEVAVLNTAMNTQRYAVRTSENAFASLISDALREASHSDVAIINGGAIRGERQYQAGHKLTREDVTSELPFRSHIRVLKITGQQLLAALENGVSEIESVSGRFPHVSGMQFTVDLSEPPGQRVKHLLVNSEPVSKTAVYTLATSDFLAGGGDGYESIKEAEEVPFSQQVTPLIVDIVISVFKRQQQLYAPSGGRIAISSNTSDTNNYD